MLDYVSARKYRHNRQLINLWNSEFRSTFPIKRSLFKDIVLEDENLNLDASFVALYDNEPVGFIFIKTWLSESGLANEKSTANISLIYVKREMRNMGIGSDLLQLAISELKKYPNIKTLVVGNDMNKIFAGIPSELNNAAIFFVNKGFQQNEAVVDMIRVARNDKVEEIETNDIKFYIATEDERDEILKLCVTNGWTREAYLVNQYYENGGSGRRIAIGVVNDDKVVAFVRFNDKNKAPYKTIPFDRDKHLGSIYFAKVDQNYQDSNYEVLLNKVAKNYLLQRGCKKIIVLATKDVKFYKELGYSAYKYYLQFELAL